MKCVLLYVLTLLNAISIFGQSLTVETIMQDPKWIGTSPYNIVWAADSKAVYFLWNPESAPGDSLYMTTWQGKTPVKVSKNERRNLPTGDVQFNKTLTRMVFEKYGDIYVHDILSKKTTQITSTIALESSPNFSGDGKKVFYTSDHNLYSWEAGTGRIVQLTDFRKGKKNVPGALSNQEKWLKEDQLRNFDVLRAREAKQNLSSRNRKSEYPSRPKEFYLDEKNVDQIKISPDEKFISFRLIKIGRGKGTIVPNYITSTGFTEDINARTKVGAPANDQELSLYDIAGDTVYQISTKDLPGITDRISFTKTGKAVNENPDLRQVSFHQLNWSQDGAFAAVVIRSNDNKDRWICLLNPVTRKLTVMERLHDDAWVSAQTGWSFSDPHSGWINSRQLWFLSEESGYSHLYLYDIFTGAKTSLTNGNYEVQKVEVGNSKKFFYFTSNEVHPGEKHFYRLPVTGGTAERITTMTGGHEVEVSPDEKNLAIRYSYSHRPWELYLMENQPGARPKQITNSLKDEFKAYPWRDPDLVTFKARDSATVYARLFKPQISNGAAVVFVHGAGYLQNAHKWWSSYFREYMFHNLLADKGYTILDLDYRASAGYGRDWRTGIYQFMGGKDLTDNLDGAKFLVDQHGIDPERIGIYGGSYGGFITLMAMFTTPDVFAAGAALRPVTDWAHYNHGYTSNILNIPAMDSLAYAKSSPIYYANGLKGALLICHGMVDVNVHFQDVVRLSQRLIELGKDNWELAIYPVEDHGFVEPSSWTDEYKRILKLFEMNLQKR